MIDQLLHELQDTWGYTYEEMSDIKEKMESLYFDAYNHGYTVRSKEVESYYAGFSSYGKREDFE